MFLTIRGRDAGTQLSRNWLAMGLNIPTDTTVLGLARGGVVVA